MLTNLWITITNPQLDSQIGHTLGSITGLPTPPKAKTNKKAPFYMGGDEEIMLVRNQNVWPKGKVGTPRTKNWNGLLGIMASKREKKKKLGPQSKVKLSFQSIPKLGNRTASD